MKWFRPPPPAPARPPAGPAGRLRTLREAAGQTRAALARAGVEAAALPAAHCRRCGLHEELAFWRFVSREGPVLRFDCPLCGERRVRLDLRTRELRGSDPLPFDAAAPGGGRPWRRGSLYRVFDYLPVLVLTVGAMLVVAQPQALLEWLERRGDALDARRAAPASAEVSAPAAGERVYTARGDRRAEVARLRAAVADEDGPDAAEGVLGVRYDAARDVTEVRLAPDAADWALRLRLRGWW